MIVSRALVLASLVVVSTAQAADTGTRWFRDHLLAEWEVGTGGWRTSIGVETRQPGFDALAGGTELVMGLELGHAVGVFGSGRVLAGGGYLEGLAGLGVQVHVSDRVRLRAGPAAGQARLGGDAAVLIGGFLVGSIDLFPLGRGRLATALSLRFDVDGLVGGAQTLPESSLALALGLGLRY